MAMESLSMVRAEDGGSGDFLHASYVQKVPEEKDHGLPERLAAAEMIVSRILVQKNMRKKPSQTMMALLIACRSTA